MLWAKCKARAQCLAQHGRLPDQVVACVGGGSHAIGIFTALLDDAGVALVGAQLSCFEFANADALVAYSGLDPRPNDSGTRGGHRRLSKKGPALLRRQVFLVGFAASHSKALSPLYRAIRAKGFATTEALVILGRKLLRVAFAIWKGGEVFDATRLMPKAA